MNWLDYFLSLFRPKPKPQPPAPPVPVPESAAAQLHSLHNDVRVRRGADPLLIDPKLMHAAQRHADWMMRNNRLSHTGESLSTFWERIIWEGYQPSMGGENIAQGYATPQDVFIGWMGSQGHKANIINPRYRHAGYAVAYSGGSTFWCVVFAAPLGVFRGGFEEFLPEPLLFSETV